MKTVLYIDDNSEMIDLVKIVLANSGCRLLTTDDSSEAADLCWEHDPDLVLLDLNMPKVNGFEVSRQMRAEGFNKPIVVLTASESEVDYRHAIAAGCSDYILKTLDMGDLKKTIERFID